MFTRHILKVNNSAEMEQAIASGILQAPYICYDASSNVANFVSPQGKEPADIDYEVDDSETLVKLDGAFMQSYRGKHGYLRTQISVPLIFKENGNYTPRVLFIRKSNYDGAYASFLSDHDSSTEADFIATLFVVQNEDGPVHPEYYYYAECLYPSDYPWGEPVTWISTMNWWGTSMWITVPVEASQNPDDDKYVIVAAYCNPSTQHAVSGNAFKIGTFTVNPGMTGSARVVWEGIQEYAADMQAGDYEGRKAKLTVPANTVYDKVRYNAYLNSEYTAETAITQASGVRNASIGQAQSFQMLDDTPFVLVNTGENTVTGCLAIQLYNSVTGVASDYKGYDIYYVDPS